MAVERSVDHDIAGLQYPIKSAPDNGTCSRIEAVAVVAMVVVVADNEQVLAEPKLLATSCKQSLP